MTISTFCSATAFLLLLIAAALVLRRRGPTPWREMPWRRMLRPAAGRPRRLRVVETLVLDPKRRVLLLDCAGREVAVLVGGGSDLLLGEAAPGFAALVAEEMS